MHYATASASRTVRLGCTRSGGLRRPADYRWLASALLTFSLTAPAAYAAPPRMPSQLLLQAAEAARTVDFEGVLVYRGDRVMEVLRVTHRFRNGHEDERIETLNGEPRAMIRRDNRIVCILPRDHHFTFDRPAVKGFLDHLSAQRLQSLVKWYALRTMGSARIAGRDCDGIDVMPKDRYRYGYQVWADSATHVPMRISLIGAGGRTLEQVMFTEIGYPSSIPDSVFRVRFDSSKFKAVTRELTPRPGADGPGSAAAASTGLSFERLPPGFRVVLRDFRRAPDGTQVRHILLSDGLSAVSVFAVPQSQEPPHGDFRGLSRMGAVEAYGRSVGEYHVTVIGEAPPVTVRMIGDQIRTERRPGPAGTGSAQP